MFEVFSHYLQNDPPIWSTICVSSRISGTFELNSLIPILIINCSFTVESFAEKRCQLIAI